MAIALRAAQASATTASGTTITMTVPAGVVSGDVMVMSVSSRSTTLPTLPSGWTLLTSNAATPATIICWRVASSEPASYSVTTPSVESAGSIIALSGASTTLPGSTQYSIQNNSTGSGTVATAALGTFASSNGIDIFLGQMNALANTPAPPTNYTEPTNGHAASGGLGSAAVSAEVAYRSLTAVTTVGALTSAAWNSSGASDGGHVFIVEAAGGTTPTNHYLTLLGVGQ